MYQQCPKCGHVRTANEPTAPEICPACGIVYAKWMRRHLRPEPISGPEPPVQAVEPLATRVLALMLQVPEQVNPVTLAGRALLWVVFLLWGLHFILLDYRALDGSGLPQINHSIMHGINLVFHEAGHVIFRLFGEFMAVLGGSLNQLLFPALALGSLLRSGDSFGASIGLWWFGQSLLDLAPYINDARAGQLRLLSGALGQEAPESHDWTNLLGRLHLLSWDHLLGGLAYGCGVLAIVAAVAWGALLLRLQWRNRANF